jgi:histidinol-phosphate aminotransferase
MSDFQQLVPEHIRSLGGYTPGKPLRQAERESGVSCIKMASNENPFGPSPKAVEAMRASVAECNFYPDNDAGELRHKLAEKNQLPPEQALVTAGSTALLGILCRTLLKPGLNAITSQRSFIVYPIATKAAGGRLIEVPMRDDGFDLEAIAAAINSDTRIVFLANPNNPTGTLFDVAALDQFLNQVPEHVTVVVDEAYYDFAQRFATLRTAHYSRSLDYVRQGRKVVVLRTFSKAHGLAGVRVGYGFGPAELMGYLGRLRTTFSISVPAQAGALAALDDDAHVEMVLQNNVAGAEVLTAGLAELGYRVIPTWANFVYCELGEGAGTVAKRLQSEGVIIRPLGPWGAPTAIRVTIGKPDQNRMFLAAFRKVMERTTA